MNTIIEKQTWKKTIIASVLFAALYILINFTAVGVAGLLQLTGGANILDFEFGYTTDKALAMLTALGEQGRVFYLTKIIPIDFPFPLSYMLFYASWIALLAKRIAPRGRIKYLLMVPFLATVFDWIENIGIISMLNNYPSLPGWAVVTASAAGILKTICTIASIMAIAFLFVAILVKRAQKNR